MINNNGQIDVFVENEAGTTTKRTYDPTTMEVSRTQTVSKPYPFAYGFVPNTISGDGDSVDCFVITSRNLVGGETILCVPMHLLEQIEDEEVDHKILCVPVDEPRAIEANQVDQIRSFISGVFSHIPGKNMQLGALRDADAAWDYLHHCSRSPQTRV